MIGTKNWVPCSVRVRTNSATRPTVSPVAYFRLRHSNLSSRITQTQFLKIFELAVQSNKGSRPKKSVTVYNFTAVGCGSLCRIRCALSLNRSNFLLFVFLITFWAFLWILIERCLRKRLWISYFSSVGIPVGLGQVDSYSKKKNINNFCFLVFTILCFMCFIYLHDLATLPIRVALLWNEYTPAYKCRHYRTYIDPSPPTIHLAIDSVLLKNCDRICNVTHFFYLLYL